MNVNANQEHEPKMFVTETTEKNLKTTAFWTKFYAILCFVGVGAMVLSGLLLAIMGSFNAYPVMETTPAISLFSNFKIIGIIYIIMGLVMIFPAVFLYQFSTNTKKSLLDNNVATLELAIVKMKMYWMFIGISSIVAICLTIIFSIVALSTVIGATSMV